MFQHVSQKLSLRLRGLFRSPAVDRELDDELRYHLDMQIQDFVRRGIPEKQAALMARRQFGNATLHKEECRDARHLAWLENLLQDFRHSFRTLRRNPGFTTVSVLTLALGIGATSALFSVLDRALLNPVTAPDADRLVWLQEFSQHHEESAGNPPRLADWQTARSFSAVGGMYSEGVVWASPAGPVQLQVLRVFGNLAGVLQPGLQLGRNFTSSETRADGPPAALLTAKAFRQRFHSNPAILHQFLRLGGTPYQVIGILGPALDFPEDADVWASARVEYPSRAAGFLNIVARLAPGISLSQAQAEIDVLSRRLAQTYPAADAGRSATLTPLANYVAQTARKPLLILFSAVAGIFLIGCLNIAGLLLARGMARRREAAIRVSVGAGYARLARLFFAESLLLSSAGCIGGLALAFVFVDVLKAYLPADVPHLAAISVDPRVVACGILLSLLSALIFGALPAWQFARGAQNLALKEKGAGQNRLRGALVVAEVALSVLLLTCAALLADSFLKLRSRPLGFNAAHAYSFELDLPWDVNPTLIETLPAEILARLNALPGTVACGVADRLPLHGGAQTRDLMVRGKELPPAVAEKEFGLRTASAGYFTAAGISIVKGALFRDWQAGQGARETVISQRLAETLFPGENPLGREIAERPHANGAAHTPLWFRIVAVVSSVPRLATDPEPAAELYLPWGATYWPLLNFVIRTERPLTDVSRYVHDQIQTLSTDQILSPLATLDESMAQTRAAPRTAAFLVGGFAVVALALAALGIFGLMAHETARRTQEIGVRLALGAEPESIAFDAVWRAVKLVAVGLALGLAAAWYASALLQTLLFEVAPHDASSYVVAAALLLLAAVIASLVPALRASRINPIQALRHE
jgi:putative ABC transport system permease protein